MPTFKELAEFMQNVGMPWSSNLLILFIMYKLGAGFLRVFEGMAKTLDHLADHFIGRGHDHGEESSHES